MTERDNPRRSSITHAAGVFRNGSWAGKIAEIVCIAPAQPDVKSEQVARSCALWRAIGQIVAFSGLGIVMQAMPCFSKFTQHMVPHWP